MKIEDLNPNPRNPRKITDERLKILKKSLEQYGDLSGIVYNRKTKRIVSGHQRSRVLDRTSEITIAKKYDEPSDKGTVALGHIKINGELLPYREVEWDEPTETAAMLAANKPAGEWDMALLPDLINELDSLNIDMELTGFDMKEIEEMMTPGARYVEGEDEVPENVPATAKIGDLYVLGDHRLLCGDSTSQSQVERLMNGEKADMVFTDPPYNVGIDYGNNTNDNRVDYDEWSLRWFKKCDSQLIVFTPGMVNLAMWYRLTTPKWLCSWRKTNQCSRSSIGGFNTWEPLLVYGKPLKNVGHDSWDIPVKQVKVDHPVPKTVEAWSTILDSFAENDTKIYEPFGGSGTTLIACEKTNRKCFMMEIDPHYCDVIVARWEKFTGKKAVIESCSPGPIRTYDRKSESLSDESPNGASDIKTRGSRPRRRLQRP